jgi:ABC-type sugar transport system substrate-binding protein
MVIEMSRPIRIALFLRTLDNDYQTVQKDACRAAAKRNRFSVTELSARNDAGEQLSQIKGCLAEPEAVRPQALLINPVAESYLLPVAEEAARLGVAFVLLNRTCAYIDQLRRKYSKVPIFCVGPDQRLIGRIQGQHFASLLPTGGEVLYIQGTSLASSAQHRLEGVKGALAGGKVQLVISQGDWSAASGTSAVQHWLRTRIAPAVSDCVVGAQNDGMAMGARAALVAAALELKRPELMDVPVTGCDGTVAQGQACVRSRELCATVVVPSSADRAVDAIAAAFASGMVPTADISMDVSSFPDVARIERSKLLKPAARSVNQRTKATLARN